MTELQNPFVIQCKFCNLIIGDSFRLLDYKDGLLIFSSLSSNTNNSEDLQDGLRIVRCNCKTEVGLYYVSGDASVKHMIGNYVIDKKSINSYWLNSDPECLITLSGLAEEVSKLKKVCVGLFHNKFSN